MARHRNPNGTIMVTNKQSRITNTLPAPAVPPTAAPTAAKPSAMAKVPPFVEVPARHWWLRDNPRDIEEHRAAGYPWEPSEATAYRSLLRLSLGWPDYISNWSEKVRALPDAVRPTAYPDRATMTAFVEALQKTEEDVPRTIAARDIRRFALPRPTASFAADTLERRQAAAEVAVVVLYQYRLFHRLPMDGASIRRDYPLFYR